MFVANNSIPGTIFNADGLLLNPDDIMPEDYDSETLFNDSICVRRGLDTLAKYNQLLADCSFSEQGKSAMAVSTVDGGPDRIPPIPPRPARDKSALPNGVPRQSDLWPYVFRNYHTFTRLRGFIIL